MPLASSLDRSVVVLAMYPGDIPTVDSAQPVESGNRGPSRDDETIGDTELEGIRTSNLRHAPDEEACPAGWIVGFVCRTNGSLTTMAPETGADGETLARTYYSALDAGNYDRLQSILAQEFVHDRPDRTIEGRDAFLRFMKSGRPSTDTTHPIDAIYTEIDGGGIAVRGRLCRSDGSLISAFVDVFSVDNGRLQALETYTP